MRISFQTFNYLVYYFSQDFTDREIDNILKPLPSVAITYCTVRRYTRLLRQILHLFVQNILQETRLDGPVEIDESCIYKLKRGRNGRLARITYRVIGLKCRTSGQTIIYPVLYRNRSIFSLFQ